MYHTEVKKLVRVHGKGGFQGREEHSNILGEGRIMEQEGLKGVGFRKNMKKKGGREMADSKDFLEKKNMKNY